MRQLPHNEFEAVIAQFLLANGSDIHFNGWPDLLVKHNNRIFAVEAKRGNDVVRPNQKAVHEVFAKAGIPVIVARPETYKADLWKLVKPPVEFFSVIWDNGGYRSVWVDQDTGEMRDADPGSDSGTVGGSLL